MNYVNKEDLINFDKKGWVVIKNVLTPEEISLYLNKVNNSQNLDTFLKSEKIKSILNIFHNGNDWMWNTVEKNNNPTNYQTITPLIRNKVESNVKQSNFEWHIDGISFHHKLMSKNISLILLPYLQCNNSKKSGQTIFKNGSHKYISNLLKNMKDGIPYLVLSLISNIFTPSELFPIEEIKISPGDILVSHPFTVHKRSLNYSDIPRICFRLSSKWNNEISKNSPIGKIIYKNLNRNTNDNIFLTKINNLINSKLFLIIHSILLEFSKYLKP